MKNSYSQGIYLFCTRVIYLFIFCHNPQLVWGYFFTLGFHHNCGSCHKVTIFDGKNKPCDCICDAPVLVIHEPLLPQRLIIYRSHDNVVRGISLNVKNLPTYKNEKTNTRILSNYPVE